VVVVGDTPGHYQRCVFVFVQERSSACTSHGNLALLIKSAGLFMSRVETGHMMRARTHSHKHMLIHTQKHTETHTHTHTHRVTTRPTLGGRQTCDVRPEDRRGQTSPSSAAAVEEHTRWLKHNCLPLHPFFSHFILFLFSPALRSIFPPVFLPKLSLVSLCLICLTQN